METVSRCTPNAHLVVIGNGMASHRLIETLLRHPSRPTRITVIGEEPVPAYNRILLSPVLALALTAILADAPAGRIVLEVTEHAAVESYASLREALENLDKDRAFLKKGGVMDDDFIDSYIELKMEEVMRLQLHPHPVEFDMYYSC